MKYVMDMGYVFRLSEANWRKVLRAIAKEESYDLHALGKQVCIVDKNITDLQPGDAQMELDWLKSKKVED